MSKDKKYIKGEMNDIEYSNVFIDEATKIDKETLDKVVSATHISDVFWYGLGLDWLEKPVNFQHNDNKIIVTIDYGGGTTDTSVFDIKEIEKSWLDNFDKNRNTVMEEFDSLLKNKISLKAKAD